MWTVKYVRTGQQCSKGDFMTKKTARLWIKKQSNITDVYFVSPEGELSKYEPGV